MAALTEVVDIGRKAGGQCAFDPGNCFAGRVRHSLDSAADEGFRQADRLACLEEVPSTTDIVANA